MPDTFECPTRGCPHPSLLHDIHDLDDPYPTCCVKGCACGQPGDAELRRDAEGVVTVVSAPHLIKVARELLSAPDLEPWVWDPQTGVLCLDTAGAWCYRYLRPWGDPSSRVDVFERIEHGRVVLDEGDVGEGAP